MQFNVKFAQKKNLCIKFIRNIMETMGVGQYVIANKNRLAMLFTTDLLQNERKKKIFQLTWQVSYEE